MAAQECSADLDRCLAKEFVPLGDLTEVAKATTKSPPEPGFARWEAHYGEATSGSSSP
jgi:hypothetical protein